MCAKRKTPLNLSAAPCERRAIALGGTALVGALTACSPTLTTDGEMAKMSTLAEVADCIHLGTSALTIEEPEDAEHHEELTIRALNLAGEIGANRIVALGRAPDNTREIRMYVCPL